MTAKINKYKNKQWQNLNHFLKKHLETIYSTQLKEVHLSDETYTFLEHCDKSN